MGCDIEPLYRYIRMGEWFVTITIYKFLKLIFVTKNGFI